jgi:hypothetical protein
LRFGLPGGAALQLPVVLGLLVAATSARAESADERMACEAMIDTPNLTITQARIVAASGRTPDYCYVRGTISPAIVFQLQLPLPGNWNGRFVNWGDGGKDGDLDYADHRVAQGYAVANSNTGHDSGAEPGASFAYNNRQAEIDFGYRAIHLTVTAAKTAIDRYYGRAPEYAYHEGCSTGGRQGLMEAQRYPADFDGIVAGAPVNHYQENNASTVWFVQQVYANDLAGNLAYDEDGDGIPESREKIRMLADAVLAQCDATDGIKDGLIDNPLKCDFDPHEHLNAQMCANDVNGPECFTRRQVDVIAAVYRGPTTAAGRHIYKGKARGSELVWDIYPDAANEMRPAEVSIDHINYLFYENDPGKTTADPYDLSLMPRRGGPAPEYAWWDFDIADLVSGKSGFMRAITDATDPDLAPFIRNHGGKLMLYHGWSDPGPSAEMTLDYYNEVVASTFGGDLDSAREHARVFMIPGMYHCRGGPGLSDWDRLAPMVDWVERGRAPDYIVGQHRSAGVVDNERKVCAYPQETVYTGPAGGRNDPANWTEGNFSCR